VALELPAAIDEVEAAGIPVIGDPAVVEDGEAAERGEPDLVAVSPRYRQRGASR
jgi:hypothetical protein